MDQSHDSTSISIQLLTSALEFIFSFPLTFDSTDRPHIVILEIFSGLNVEELLVSLHAPELMLKPFRVAGGSVGVFASAYVLYKVAAPLRYALTLWLTPVIVRRLRLGGRLPPLAEQDRLRNLALEGAKRTRERLRRRQKKRSRILRK